MTIIWCMVPEIWSMTDNIFCHFGLFFALLPSENNPKNQNFDKLKKMHGDILILHKCTKNHDYMWYCSLDVHDRCNCYFSFWASFCPFTSLTAQNIKIKKKKSTWRYHHFTIVYQSHDYMLYCVWDMPRDRCNYFSFWTIFCPFTPLTAQKIKILKKWKKHLEISSFYICVPKIMIRWCTVPEIWCATDG